MSDIGGFAYVRDLNPYQLNAMDGHFLAAAFRECADEIERLTAIVNRLPTTADGVPVTPGMSVWSRNGRFLVVAGYHTDHDGKLLWYSSEEAAQAAREPMTQSEKT